MQFLFDGHILDADRRELCRGSEPIAVEPQVLDLLICLVQNCDRVVSKDDLIASILCGRIASDADKPHPRRAKGGAHVRRRHANFSRRIDAMQPKDRLAIPIRAQRRCDER